MHKEKGNFKREEKNDFIIGFRPIIEAIRSAKEIDKVFIQNGLQSPLFKELMILLKEKEIPYQFVPIEKLNRINRINHQGVAASISQATFQKIEDILPQLFEKGKIPLLLILDRITDVRNFGAIARSAECAGVNAIIIPQKGGASINADALKTSAGALHKINVCREHNLKETIDYLKESGLQIIGCTEKASDYYYQTNYKSPTAIIMGSEENGISDEYLKRCDKKVKIPMLGTIDSLNVSVAAGIILFETVKQRIQ
jgi:23S rRNA (guanosine2251-2'-O)-methyltransferase